MTYDLMFARRRPDQTWVDVTEEVEEQDDLGDSPDPEVWRRVVERATQMLGEVSLLMTDHYGEIGHEPTHIQVSLSVDWPWAEMHAPYGATGADATATLKAMYLLGTILQEETGLEGYDPRSRSPLTEAAADLDLGFASFEAVAQMLRRQLSL